MPRDSIDQVFEPMHTRRGSLRCRICQAVVAPPDPTSEDWALPFWSGYPHLMGHPWPCHHCDRAFLSPAGLKRHTEAAHRRPDTPE